MSDQIGAAHGVGVPRQNRLLHPDQPAAQDQSCKRSGSGSTGSLQPAGYQSVTHSGHGFDHPHITAPERHDNIAGDLVRARDPETGHLFLPFQDETSGRETYGAGRYLEVPVLEDGQLLLDFNYAYHPFCAYNPGYSCPIPPFENRLPVAIRAGERNPD